ncbi:MAG: response regulator [Ruminococcus sp.]|nr:response regulator [Ruminococcus sp.]MCM1382530.1 response regulator [Muribaculaceae bacterium]MCM1478673.1 response regulator [Muribaculaceae bacterium]
MSENKHILVVDDVPANLKYAQQLLSGRYKLTLASSGAQALKFLKKNVPDLILLDINMPEMDGCAVIAELKKEPSTAMIPIIILTSEVDTAMELKCLELGAVDFIRKPFITEIMLSRIDTQLELSAYRNRLEYMVTEKTAVIERLQDVMSTCFAELVESRDGTTGGHIKNTTRYFAVFLEELSKHDEYKDILTPQHMKNLVRAAPLHDIGKIGINDSVLRKETVLNEEEFDHMKTHTQIGGETFRHIFSSVEGTQHHSQLGADCFDKIFDSLNVEEGEDTLFLHVARDMAMYHHERWNGTGYPTGISGEDIPLSARILSIVDVYDALTSKRSYKEAFSHEKAMEIIIEDREIFFDPKLTDIFVTISDKIKQCLLTKDEI